MMPQSKSSTTTRGRTVARRRSGRLTPYSTVRRNTDHNPDYLSDHTPTTEQLEVITNLLSRTWTMYYASPLWKFENTSAKLRSYSKQLTMHIASSSSVASASSGPPQYVAKLTVKPQFGMDGSGAVEIAVRKRSSRKGAPDLLIVLCRATEGTTDKPGFTEYPMLLSHGLSPLCGAVLQWLQISFDCYISPARLEPNCLSSLVSHYATHTRSGRSLGNVEIVYSVPSPVQKAGLSSISIELPYESVLSMWNSKPVQCAEGEGEVGKREAFMKLLEEHIQRHFHLKLQCMSMTRISTPVLHAEVEGKLKFHSASCVLPVLSSLQAKIVH